MAEVARVAARETQLVAEPLERVQVLDGDPRPASFVAATLPDGAESGVWRCTPGRFRDVEVDETFVEQDLHERALLLELGLELLHARFQCLDTIRLAHA